MSRVKALLGRGTFVLLLLLVVLLVVMGCRGNPAATTSPIPRVTPQQEPLPTPTPRVELPVSRAPAALALSFNGEVRAKEQVSLSAKLPGRIAELKVEVGDQVKKKDLLVVLEHEAMDAQIKQAEAALVAAQARLDLLLAGPNPEQLRIAEFQVEMAEQELTLTTYRTSTYSLSPALMETYMMLRLEEIKSARQQVDLARQQLELLKSPPRQEELAQLKAGVDGARAQLEALKAPPRLQQVAQLQAAVDASRAQLEALKSPPRPQQVAQLKAGVEAAGAQVALAQAALQLARAQREEAFLYSPLDGWVAYRGLGLGSLVMPGVPILTILLKEVEVVITVDELALGQVSLGQSVSITAPAYPAQVFAGKVRAIAPMANPATRAFEVYIEPQDPKGLLRPGMFAAVSLTKGEGF